MRKSVFWGLGLALSISLAACSPAAVSGPDASAPPGSSAPAISDYRASDPVLHQVLAPLELEDGQHADHLYYDRKIVEDGTVVYLVQKAADGQWAYLPVEQTVVYTGNYEEGFYEAVEISYLLDGEPEEMVQYHLFVPRTDAD